MGILSKIKEDVKKSGQNKSQFIFFKEDVKTRVRFLIEMDEGMEVTFHDSFKEGVNSPCLETFGEDCDMCEDESLRTRSMYIWPVYDYEAKKVKLIMAAVNNCSPVPGLIAFHETYGTIKDRDYIITSTGKGTSKSFSIVPMDKAKFRNDKAKPLSESKILSAIKKAYLVDIDEDEDDEPIKKKSKKKTEVVEDEEWDEDSVDYSEMTAKELFKLCKENEIEVEPKKPSKYYINLLQEYDKAQDDWGDEEDDSDDSDDWEED